MKPGLATGNMTMHRGSARNAAGHATGESIFESQPSAGTVQAKNEGIKDLKMQYSLPPSEPHICKPKK